MPRRPDYDAIAPRYDTDRAVFKHEPDQRLADHLVRRGGTGALVADVGCGTGSWCVEQTSHAERPVVVGIEPSAGMAAVAASKGGRVRVIRGSAEALPVASSSVTWLSARFAHHLFDLPRFVDEAARSLEPGGVVCLVNLYPPDEDGFLLNRFFPGVREIDRARFPRPDHLAHLLERGGLGPVRLESSVYARTWTVDELLAAARSRTASQLSVLDETGYRAGVREIERLRASNPLAELSESYIVYTWLGAAPA